MAALGDADGGDGANRSGGGDVSTSPLASASGAPTRPAQTMLTDGYKVASQVFPHCEYCAACPLAPQHPATPVQDTTTTPCRCQTDHWVDFAIVRYSGNFLRLLSRDDARRALAIFFSLLTVVFVLVPVSHKLPACSYLLSTGLIAHMYSSFQLTAIWKIVVSGGSLPSWISDNVFLCATFTCDLVLSYLLLSSSSVAVLGVNGSRWWYNDDYKGLARCSIAWSFATFFFAAMSSVFSGYKLYERMVFLPSASSGTKPDDANQSTVGMVPLDDDDAGVANPGCDVGGGADAPATASQAPTAPTVVHVWALPPSAGRLLQYPTATLNPIQDSYKSTALTVFLHNNKVLDLLKRDHARRTLAIFFSFVTVVFVLAWRMLDVAAFRYLFSTGLIAFAYSMIRLIEGTWETAIKASVSHHNSVCCYLTYIFDLVLSYLLISSSSVAVLGLKDTRSRTPACISIVWSFATFLFVAISSVFSGCKLCRTIIKPLASNELDYANKLNPWTDPLLANSVGRTDMQL